jgi:hypothetical protein
MVVVPCACGSGSAGDLANFSLADQSISTPEDTPISITLVMAPASVAASFDVTNPPGHGSLRALRGPGPMFSYSPTQNYVGEDSFSVRGHLGAATATATVSITITPVNDAPHISVSAGAVRYIEGTSPLVIDSRIEIADSDGASLDLASVRIASGCVPGEDELALAGV